MSLLLAIARRWNVNDRQARRTFPKLWSELSTRSQGRIRADAAERALERRRVVVELINTIHDEGRYPSQAEVKKRLPPRISFQDLRLVVVWRDEIERLGYRRQPRQLTA